MLFIKKNIILTIVLLILSINCYPISPAIKSSPIKPGKEIRSALERVSLFTIIQAVNKKDIKGFTKMEILKSIRLLKNTPSRQGMFVSIFNARTKRTIGCMGGLYPVRSNLYDEVRHWTMVALLLDPRKTVEKEYLKFNNSIDPASLSENKKVALIISLVG